MFKLPFAVRNHQRRHQLRLELAKQNIIKKVTKNFTDIEKNNETGNAESRHL